MNNNFSTFYRARSNFFVAVNVLFAYLKGFRKRKIDIMNKQLYLEAKNMN